MESAVRCLRDGRVGKVAPPAAIVLLEDSLDVAGGAAVFRQVASELAAAVGAQRAQGRSITALALERPAGELQEALACAAGHVLDCHANAFGWRQSGACGAAAPSHVDFSAGNAAAVLRGRLLGDAPHTASGASTAAAAMAPAAGAGGIAAIQPLCAASVAAPAAVAAVQPHNAAAAPGAPRCLVVDSLSMLMQYIGTQQALSLLEELAAHPSVSCILAGLHTDLHAPEVLASARALTACRLCLACCSGLEAELAAAEHGRQPHGRIDARHKRRSGRVKVESELYALLPGGRLATFAVPSTQATPQLLAAKALSGAAAAASKPANGALGGAGASLPKSAAAAGALVPAAALEQQFAGGMRLGLTQQERADREAVVLPYEHTGRGAAYTAGDARAYLPPAAGGLAPGAGSGGLGHIMYVRDTDSEYDSDEDPDDDLDI